MLAQLPDRAQTCVTRGMQNIVVSSAAIAPELAGEPTAPRHLRDGVFGHGEDVAQCPKRRGDYPSTDTLGMEFPVAFNK
ncbi:MAG: hypothetical protein V7K97_02985 [Nostoc sp.]|uniref:hypothetical protein n=1 Tax=Nostoc sp. TaxID=1180 RepID=UPI002FF652A3